MGGHIGAGLTSPAKDLTESIVSYSRHHYSERLSG